jgi:hypothetical protein
VWRRSIPLPLEEHEVTLPAGTFEPLITPEQALRIRQRLAGHSARAPQKWTQYTLLHNCHAFCARCHKPLRLSSRRRDSGRTTLAYICRTHELQRDLCPTPFYVSARTLDVRVWTHVRALLLESDTLRELAERQAALDAADDPASRLTAARNHKQQLEQQAGNLIASIRTAASEFVRKRCEDDLARLEPLLIAAGQQVEEYELTAQKVEARRQFLADLDVQVGRHSWFLEELDPADLETSDLDVLGRVMPVLHSIVTALGLRVTVSYDATRTLQVSYDFTLGASALTPWFEVPQLEDWPGGGVILSDGTELMWPPDNRLSLPLRAPSSGRR